MSQKNRPEYPKPRVKRRVLLWPGALLILIAVFVGFYFHHSTTSADEKLAVDSGKQRHRRGLDDAPVVVAVETARRRDFPVYLTGLGTVTALRKVTLHSRVDGELIKVNFDEGQWVKEGEVLAEIDPRPFQVQLQQAEGQLMRDEALLRNAEIDHARYQTLLAQESISAQQTLTQEALVKQYRGNVEMDRAQVNNAKLQLGYAKLTAPIAGQVGLRQIDQGNMVHANDLNGLVVITQLNPITVVFTVPEDKLQSVMQSRRNHPAIAVEAYDRSGKIKLAEGSLLAMDNQIDPSTGTIKLKAQFDNHEHTLFANQFVNIKMHLDTLRGVTQISSAAVQHDSEGAFVYVVGDQKTAQMRRVTLGQREADQVAVLDNLSENDAVVLEGADRLHEGSRVDVSQKDGQAVAASPDLEIKPEGKSRKRDKHS